MSTPAYLHGFATDEQQRLIQQARYWRHTLIRPGLDYKPGDRVLDVGCGVGAVLRVLAAEFPGIRCSGIDLEPRQIEFARRYLAAEKVEADLRVGNAAALPWGDGAFDHVYMMWFLEHLRDPVPVLREARRVLRPRGTIALVETDYTTFKVWPPSRDWDALEQAQHDHFLEHGCEIAGRRLGTWLHEAGFSSVRSGPMGFHFFAADNTEGVRVHANYIADFLEPAIPALAARSANADVLSRGIAHLRSLHTHPGAAITNIVYKAFASA